MNDTDISEIFVMADEFLTAFDQAMIDINFGYSKDDLRYSGSPIHTLESVGELIVRLLSQDDDIEFECKKMAFQRMKTRFFYEHFLNNISIEKAEGGRIYNHKKLAKILTKSYQDNISIFTKMKESLGQPIPYIQTNAAKPKGP